MSKKIHPSWERYTSLDDIDVHSPEGVERLATVLKQGLIKKYMGMCQSMFQYETEDPRLEDMNLMSRNTAPECFLSNGECAWFEFEGQIHCLPLVNDNALNMYGFFNHWRVIPSGYETSTGPELQEAMSNETFSRIMNMELNNDNSVIMRNDIFGSSDKAFVESMVNLLVDDILTINQKVLLARSPFLFRVPKNSSAGGDAKDFFLALAQCRPAIIGSEDMTLPENFTEKIETPMDASLLDVFREWENLLLEQLGIPGSIQNTKRAQQSVAEVGMAEDKTSLRREEKRKQRQYALDQMEKMWGLKINLISVIDSMEDDAEAGGTGKDDTETQNYKNGDMRHGNAFGQRS